MKKAFNAWAQADLEVIRPTTMTDMQNLRNQGLREACVNEIKPQNAKKLVWLEYYNGRRVVNIWRKV